METSNIIGGSNVYPCKGNPLSDQEFVNQIEDYNYIKTIHKMQEFQQSSIHLTKKQIQLLEIEIRCVYAPKDPCWGYINGQGVRSRCIEGKCPRIKQCNPTYTQVQADDWTMTEEVKTQYGRVEKQRKYYLVDLVSDEEMLRYSSDPKGAGMEFPPMKDSKIAKPKNKQKSKGRHLVIIGYEETYFGDADNQLSPIWGYIDDSEEDGTLITSRYGSRTEHIHKNAIKVEEKTKKKNITKERKKRESKPVEVAKELSAEKKQHYEQAVNNKLSNRYHLTEISEEIQKQLSAGKIINMILSNEAEMAYVSSMLSQAAIAHDMECVNRRKAVCLWKAQTKTIKLDSGIVLVSSAFLKQGCDLKSEAVWLELKKVSVIQELAVTGRDFFHFESTDSQERWGCRNLYGATHLVVKLEDFKLTENVSGEQKINLIKGAKNYSILSTSSEEQLGTTTEALWSALDSLKKADEISEFPRMIAGLILKETKSGLELKGIGHMKFDEY